MIKIVIPSEHIIFIQHKRLLSFPKSFEKDLPACTDTSKDEKLNKLTVYPQNTEPSKPQHTSHTPRSVMFLQSKKSNDWKMHGTYGHTAHTSTKNQDGQLEREMFGDNKAELMHLEHRVDRWSQTSSASPEGGSTHRSVFFRGIVPGVLQLPLINLNHWWLTGCESLAGSTTTHPLSWYLEIKTFLNVHPQIKTDQ